MSELFYRHVEGHPHYPTHNMPMRHAFVVVGSETIFLCHLINLWMEGHNYELALEVRIPEAARQALLKDRAVHGKTHFLGNQEKAMIKLPEIKSGALVEFPSDVWAGLPEKMGKKWPWENEEPLLRDVPVTIAAVTLYRHVTLNTIGRTAQAYFLFGKGNEAHLYHSVVREPDYDHVASLTCAPEWIQPEQLAAGVDVTFPALEWSPDRTECTDPLVSGRHTVLYYGIRQYRDHRGRDHSLSEVPPYHVEVDRTWWFATSVANFPGEDPCR
jgi:hypothetical protein